MRLMQRRGDLWERFGGSLRADLAKLIGAGWQPSHDTPTGLAALVQKSAAHQERHAACLTASA